MTTITRKRRLSEKQVNKILAEYDLPGRVAAIMAELGPYVWKTPYPYPDEARGQRPIAALRDYVVLTRRGFLGVSVHDDWIPCVFEDAEAGAHVGASLPSGKWNHHAFVKPCHGSFTKAEIIERLDDMLVGFRRELWWLTPGSELRRDTR